MIVLFFSSHSTELNSTTITKNAATPWWKPLIQDQNEYLFRLDTIQDILADMPYDQKQKLGYQLEELVLSLEYNGFRYKGG